MTDQEQEQRSWLNRLVCFGGGCGFGYCEQSKSLADLLVDIYASADVETTIGSAIKPGAGCRVCDVVSKIPPPQRKKKLHEDEVNKREAQLTRIQMGKATTTERS